MRKKELIAAELYALSPEDESHKLYVSEKLKESEEWAANPDAKWTSHEEFMNEAWEIVRKIEKNEV